MRTFEFLDQSNGQSSTMKVAGIDCTPEIALEQYNTETIGTVIYSDHVLSKESRSYEHVTSKAMADNF